jgi:hypothetical protein
MPERPWISFPAWPKKGEEKRREEKKKEGREEG